MTSDRLDESLVNYGNVVMVEVAPTSSLSLNPNAVVFESSSTSPTSNQPQTLDSADKSVDISVKGYLFMNGETTIMPSPAVLSVDPLSNDESAPEMLSPSPASLSPQVVTKTTMNGDQIATVQPKVEGLMSQVAEGGSAAAAGGVGADNPSRDMSRERLKQALAAQLEYYFSRENLANDTYLVSQMDGDQYVPIWTVANFNQIKKLTTDIKLITEVLKESSNVQVDEEELRVRPNHKRCIVILREIDGSTPVEEVRAIFADESLPNIVSCEFAHNNVWYITFESDDDAQKAYHYVRDNVKEYKGHPINARIKAKPSNRFFGLPSGVSGGMGVGMGLVSPAAVPLPVPVILAPGAALPVAVAPVPPNAVPIAAAAVAAAATAATTAPILSAAAATVAPSATTTSSTTSTPLKNGYSVPGAGTPPLDSSPTGGSSLATTSQPHAQQQQPQQQQPHHHHQQQPHAQGPHQQQQQHQPPRFLYAAPPTPGTPHFGATPPLQLYAFHQPASFYTPTLLQAWPGPAAGAPFFDLGQVFTMNGLSPQATFKPSPNPRYPNVSGRGRGGHRRNPSHASSTSSVGDQQSAAAMAAVHSHGSSPSAMQSNSNSSSNNSSGGGGGGNATGAIKSASNGPASLPAAVKGGATNGSSSSSALAGAPSAADPASSTANNAAAKGRDREGVVHSTSQFGNQPQTQQLPAKGQQQHPPAEANTSGGYPSTIEDRRNDRDSTVSDRGVERSVGYAGVGMGSGRGRGRPRGRRRDDDYPHGPSNYGGRGGPSSDRSEMDSRGERPSRGGYSSYYRGGSNGSYRGGDRMDRDQRHGSYGSGYNGRSNGSGHSAHHSSQHPQQQQSQQSHHHPSHHQQANSASPAPEFDLQAESAFPPLPGLEAGVAGTSQSPAAGATGSASVEAPPKADETGNGSALVDIGAWESKLSDVVKGVAKPKLAATNSSGSTSKPLLNGPSSGGSAAPAAHAAPASSTATAAVTKTPAENSACPLPNGDLAQSTLALTPPTSPGKKEKTFSAPNAPPHVKSSKKPQSPQPTPIESVDLAKSSGASGVASGAGVAPSQPPSLSYAKMAQQNKERLEQLAREVKERELEQERERRRELAAGRASQAKVAANQGKTGARAGGVPVSGATVPASCSSPSLSSSSSAASVASAVTATAVATPTASAPAPVSVPPTSLLQTPPSPLQSAQLAAAGGGQRNERRKDGKTPHHSQHAVAASGGEERGSRDRSKSP